MRVQTVFSHTSLLIQCHSFLTPETPGFETLILYRLPPLVAIRIYTDHDTVFLPNPALLQGQHASFCTVRHPQFRDNHLHMGFDRPRADVQDLSDLPVRFSLGDHLENRQLPGPQRFFSLTE